MYLRYCEQNFKQYLKPNKILVLLGPRQVGKTTLVKNLAAGFTGKKYYGVGDDAFLRRELEKEELPTIQRILGGYDLIIIDEAQRIRNIGLILKLMVDNLDKTQIIATGSSSFELSQQVGEPLTGRKETIYLFPISFLELNKQFGSAAALAFIDEMLIFGSYPECLTRSNAAEKQSYLAELRDALLFKDILELEQVRNSRKLFDLLTLLAFQIGKDVSISELGKQLTLGNATVARYLDLLEKSFIIKNIRGFSRNLRKEVTKTSRYYFIDNGIRNAVINNFNPLSSRNDTGMLWENFVVTERLKKQRYRNIITNNFFWRTYNQQEIDFVEEREGRLYGFEMKYSHPRVEKPPPDWIAAYPGAKFQIISKETVLEFLV